MDSLSSSDPRPSSTPPTRNAWSRSPDAERAASMKLQASPAPPTEPLPIPAVSPVSKESEENQVRVLMPGVGEPLDDNVNSAAVEDQTSLADARIFDDACANGNDPDNTSGETKASGKFVEAHISKPTWRKPCVGIEGECAPVPVMGASVWPALAEARSIKGPKSSGLKTPPPLPSKVTLANHSSHSEGGLARSHHPAGHKHKSSFKEAPLGSTRSACQSVENGSSVENHVLGNNHVQRTSNHQAPPPMDHERTPHRRYDGMAPFANNSRKWRNNNRDHGRANFGWHQQGRFFENGADMTTLLHEQRIGPRNMPRHFPYMHVNPAYYPGSNFQNGGMYYFSPSPDFVQGHSYYPMMTPLTGMRHGPEPESLQSMLLKQVDYYFSIENLCRDIFLRAQMDEQGFVPVSVIANFNRIRKLTSNLTLILEALKQSNVVEVQGDRIRRCNDGGKWRLLPEQVSAVNMRREATASVRSTEEMYVKQGASQGIAWVNPSKNSPSTPPKTAQPAIVEPKGVDSVEERDALCCNWNVSKVPNGAVMEKDASSASCVNGQRLDRGEDNDIARQNEGETSSFCACSESKSGEVNTSDHKYSLTDSRVFEGSHVPPQRAVADVTTINWSTEGVPRWMGDNAFLIPSQFECNGSLPLEPEYLLNSHDDGEEDHVEVNDRDVQRLINSSHSALSSFIAVP